MAVGLLLAGARAVRAGHEDAALFYEELAQYGNWVEYGTYGPVWYPTRVTENWRPYLDGRWVPTEGGWVFETSEPWGWIVYHYGNWMPTEEYGWVWVPGRTWYPSTVAWRSSEEYIGWAPIPPPGYVPPPAYYPPGGYYPGISALDLITAPFWIFAQAVHFLLGFGLPYAPTYSYYNCGCLVPFTLYPTIYPRTFWITEYYYPVYAPGAYFFFGPSFPFVSRVCRVPLVRITTFVREVKVITYRNVLPPRQIWERRPHLREVVPASVREGRWEVRRRAELRPPERLARPDVMPRPRDLPALPKIERVTPKAGVAPEVTRPPVEGLRPGVIPPRRPPEAKPEVPRPVTPERLRPPEVTRPPVERRPEVPERLRPREGRPPEVTPPTAPNQRLRPEAPERRGLRLPPQAVPEERQLRQQRQRDLRLERSFPPEQQRQFRRQEQELRRQEIFRPTRPAAPPPRMEQPRIQPRQAPPPAPERRAPPRDGGSSGSSRPEGFPGRPFGR
jgi:hypothetical protein